ncbi:hypothetical protein [Mangrovicoccus algicola]|uniref:Uncharacterized protein n=1 Tax=Mangrovicoccus algicola TaxID=2771008 RepID=A0A8J7CGT6_9RHOB|nr:hypothetical protein [Mangrovicoccus algicola]MBE3637485.1 hypothetical protein [Mangrovicoccus algicola]
MTALSLSDRTFALRRARMVLRGGHAQADRDAAIGILWDHDPRASRNLYAQHLAMASDARLPARTRGASIDWLIAHTASTDRLGQARLSRLISGAMTVGEPA